MLSLPSLKSPCHLVGRDRRRLGLIRLPIHVAKAPVCDKKGAGLIGSDQALK